RCPQIPPLFPYTTLFRSDYQPFPFRLSNVELELDLDAALTRVTSHLVFERVASTSVPLVLNGQDLDLISVAIDGRQLEENEYGLDRKSTRLNSSHVKISY